jgi:hypothetical protein
MRLGISFQSQPRKSRLHVWYIKVYLHAKDRRIMMTARFALVASNAFVGYRT